MIKAAKILVILVMSITLLTGCKNVKNDDNGLNCGFDSGEPLSNYWSGLTSDKTRLKVGENLTIKFYYGTSANLPDDLPYNFQHNGILPDNILTEMVIGHGICTKELLQKGEYTYKKPEYTYESQFLEENVYKEIPDFTSKNYPLIGANSAFETITIPSDWFFGEMGVIRCSIAIYGAWLEGVDRENSTGTSKCFYYRIEDDNVILYDSYYKFFNDIRK